jgi:hypothetical protein
VKILIPAHFDVKSHLPLSEQNSVEDATMVQFCRNLTNYIRNGIVHSLVGICPLFKTKIKTQSSMECNSFCPQAVDLWEAAAHLVSVGQVTLNLTVSYRNHQNPNCGLFRSNSVMDALDLYLWMLGSNPDLIAGYLPKVLIVFFLNISKRMLWCCFTIYHDLMAVYLPFISRLRFLFQMSSTPAVETVSLNKVKVLLIME